MTEVPWLNDTGANFTGAWNGSRGSAAGVLSTTQPPTGGFSLNLATGQNAAGLIQTQGDLPDANWTVTNADNYENAPVSYTVAPGEADWSPYWLANGPNSSWIAADPNAGDNGNMTFTFKFNLTGYDPADATLIGGQFAADDDGAVFLNGHQIGADSSRNWEVLHPLSNGAGDFVAGMNTLVIQVINADDIDEAGRLEGSIVDMVSSSTPVRWASAVSGSFATATNWTGGHVPGALNDAILDPSGAAFTVMSSISQSVNSIQTAANASLDINGGTFTATAGTGTGSNGGAIVVGDGADLAIGGTLANIGSIGLAGTGGITELIVDANGATLIGGGAVSLSDNPHNLILASTAGATLTNVDNTIAGAGDIGDGGDLQLVNSATGVIDASDAIGLVIATGSNPVENAGLMEGTGVGGLVIRDTTIDGSTGGVIAAANGSHVALQGADLIGGTLQSTGTGLIWTFLGANELDGSTSPVTNRARLILHNSTALTIEGAIVNTNELGFNGSGADTRIVVGATGATLSGGGKVILDNEADNIITGASAAATLTNVDNVINGAGQLGLGSMTLVNEAKGVIVGSHAIALTIDTGSNTVVNAGELVSRGTGGMIIKSAVNNSGLMDVVAGVMTAEGAVSGTGTAAIAGGVLDFTSAFSQNVTFGGASGRLELAQSRSYAGTISGFSTSGGTSLDLGDIGFVSSTEATFSGTASGGVLTVTDGKHTAQIALSGDYLASTFTAGSDGYGGTIVVDPTTDSPAPTHRFIAAAASLGDSAGEAIHTPDAHSARQPVLANPRLMTA